jgi:hypothetical protein
MPRIVDGIRAKTSRSGVDQLRLRALGLKPVGGLV